MLDLPQPLKWISHLSDAEYEALVQPLPDPGRVSRPWVEMALVHPSYLRTDASAGQRDQTRLLLRAIEQSGVATIDLALAAISVVAAGCSTAAEANAVVRLARGADPSSAIADRFQLAEHSAYGPRGRPRPSDPNTVKKWASSVGNAFLGACSLDRYQNGYSLVRDVVDLSELRQSPSDAYKPRLQEVAQKRRIPRPSYTLVDSSGPAHERQFRIAVSVGGLRAEGEGRTVRRAEEAAARELFTRWMPVAASPILPNRLPPKLGSKFEFEKLRGTDRHLMEELSERLGLPGTAPRLSRAFLHSTYLRENGIRPEEGNPTLAFIGSGVLAVWAARLQLRAVLAADGDDLPDALTISPWDAAACADAATALGLDGYLLLGRGAMALNERVLAETFQALLGALYVELGEPEAIADRLSPAVSSLQTAFEVGWTDAKTRLIRRLVPSGIELTFDHEAAGPDHEREFRAHATLLSAPLRRSLRVSGAWQASRRAAEKAAAAAILHALARDPSAAGEADESAGARGLQEFVARHECRVAPTSRPEALAWFRRGALGTSFLKSEQIDAFLAWANLLQAYGEANEGRLNQFYRACGESAPSMNPMVITAAVGRLIDWVNGLSVDSGDPPVVETNEFRELLDLAVMARFSASPAALLNIREEVEGFVLLQRVHDAEVALGSIPDRWIIGVRGAFGTMLSRVISRSWRDLPVSGLRLEGSASARGLEVTISAAEAPAPPAGLGHGDILFDFLRSTLGILAVTVAGSAVGLTLRTIPDDNGWGSRFIRAYRSPSEHSDPERSEIARVLHDLKNELLAYASNLRQWSSASRDSTPSLALRYQAGRHIDSARALATSLAVLASAYVVPEPEEFDFVLFLREYLAQKILSTPAAVRLVTPLGSVSALPVTMPRDYLQSILDNLIKNSVEAMPEGGELRIDWTYVGDERMVILEVSDTGVGLDPEQVRSFLSGVPMASTKSGGSALGLATVRGMVHRIGGDIEVTSTPGLLTRWTVTLPDSLGGREP